MHSSSAQRLATVVIGDTIIVLLLHNTPFFRSTGLMAAVWHGHLPVIKALVSHYFMI